MPELITKIAQFLLGLQRPELVPVQQLYDALPEHEPAEIGDALHRMREQHLIRATFQNDSVQLSPEGITACNDGSVVELTMGIEYVAERYGAATVHIIVTGVEGETGGSGFFSADYPGRVVTAGHVLRGREILRIENARREIIARPPFETLLGVDELDLGMIACVCPAGINPIQIEWRRALIRPMDSLLVLGFPPYPNRLQHLTIHPLICIRSPKTSEASGIL